MTIAPRPVRKPEIDLLEYWQIAWKRRWIILSATAVLLSLAIFFFLWSKRGAWDDRPGFTFGLYLVLAGTERFLVEFIRLNAPVALGLTMAQWISAALILLGIVLIRRVRRR